MVDLAIIDTGISLNCFDNVASLESNICFSDVNNVHEDTIPENTMTHGTICASIIRTYAPSVLLHNLNVFINGICNVESIVMAIQYCLERNIRVINISFGTNYIKDDTDLKNVINLATDKGVIIIASARKNGIVTYPAHYSNVISVGVKTELHLRKNKIKINDNTSSLINVFACGIQHLYKGGRLIHVTTDEPSYATAVVSALVYNALCDLNGETNSRKVIEVLSKEDKDNEKQR